MNASYRRCWSRLGIDEEQDECSLTKGKQEIRAESVRRVQFTDAI
jgi:hypothetical protein